MAFEQTSLAIVDVETTGSRSHDGRIIEIGVLRIEEGRLVKTFSTLLNPKQPIPPTITQLTGIIDADVKDAPTFDLIKDELVNILADCVFVAHNASFDYGFVKHEFKRVGIDFNAQTVCSVKLSRKLFPEHQHHNLGVLIERFGLPSASRHRALDDAKVVWDFLQTIRQTTDVKVLETVWSQMTLKPVLPSHLNLNSFDDIPEEQGIYLFYDANDKPLYVGKASHLREKLMGYFEGLPPDGKRAQMMSRLKRIKWQTIFGELTLKLLQQHLIRELKPAYNFPIRFPKEQLKPARWPFDGMLMIEEQDPFTDKKHVFSIDHWIVTKAIEVDGDEITSLFSCHKDYDPAMTKMLYSYIKNNPRNIKVVK